MSPRRRVVVLADDLMVRSRLEAAASDEVALEYPRDQADFEARLDPPPDLVLVGLTATRLPWVECIRAARDSAGARDITILAFGPHKDLELRARALQAGANRVLANSALMLALPGLLRGESPPSEESD